MKFKKILVPIDFSEFSDKAADFALLIAEKFSAEVMLLHTVLLFEEDLDEEDLLESYEQILQQKEDKRTKKIKSHREGGEKRGVTVDHVLMRGVSAPNSILDYLEGKDYDLVVMGTHGRTGLAKFFAGSVTEKVTRYAKTPVVTVHKDYHREKIEKILVPIDFSEYSRIAISQAKTMAEEFGAALEFMHVVEQDAHPEFYSISFDPILKANPALKEHIITNLKKDEAKFVVREGKSHQEIMDYAGANDIDLIVMPTCGNSDLEDILMGSTTERVVRLAPCPVLTVRKKE